MVKTMKEGAKTGRKEGITGMRTEKIKERKQNRRLEERKIWCMIQNKEMKEYMKKTRAQEKQ